VTNRYSEEEVIMTVTRLTRTQLDRYVDAQLVRPLRAKEGLLFSEIDIARLELVCDLSEDLDLDEIAVGIVLSLVDQLHGARRDLTIVAEVIETLPEDLRRRIDTMLQQR